MYQDLLFSWQALYPDTGVGIDAAKCPYRPPSASSSSGTTYSALPAADDEGDEEEVVVRPGKGVSSIPATAVPPPYGRPPASRITGSGGANRPDDGAGLIEGVGKGAQIVLEEFSKMFGGGAVAPAHAGAFSATLGTASPSPDDDVEAAAEEGLHSLTYETSALVTHTPTHAASNVNGVGNAPSVAGAPLRVVAGVGDDDEETVTF